MSGAGGGIPSWVRKDAKVVAISTFDWHAGPEVHAGKPLPQKLQTYTISGLWERDPAFIELAEIGATAVFHFRGFRPAVPKKTEADDVALIKSLIARPDVATTQAHTDA